MSMTENKADVDLSIMQYGMYKGKSIKEVPDDYLEWIIQKKTDEVEFLQRELDGR